MLLDATGCYWMLLLGGLDELVYTFYILLYHESSDSITMHVNPRIRVHFARGPRDTASSGRGFALTIVNSLAAIIYRPVHVSCTVRCI